MEYCKDIHGDEYRTDKLYSLVDIWEMARLEGGLTWHNVFEKALFNAIAFTKDKDWRYGDIESLSDILDYYAMAFTESGELVELADEPPYEK